MAGLVAARKAPGHLPLFPADDCLPQKPALHRPRLDDLDEHDGTARKRALIVVRVPVVYGAVDSDIAIAFGSRFLEQGVAQVGHTGEDLVLDEERA